MPVASKTEGDHLATCCVQDECVTLRCSLMAQDEEQRLGHGVCNIALHMPFRSVVLFSSMRHEYTLDPRHTQSQQLVVPRFGLHAMKLFVIP